MLRNYWKIAFRNLLRNKTYSSINILGLSLGVACCLMLTLYIQDELSFDAHHADRDRLYRIVTQFHSDQGIDKLGTTSPPIGMTMGEEIADIEVATRVLNPPGVAQNLIKYNDVVFYETNGFVADSTLFQIFTYDFLQGNPKNALVHANSVVISESLAKKLFGTEPALDKQINISQNGPAGDYHVTGVFRENYRSHLKANFFISMTSTSSWAEYIRTSPEAQGEWAGQNFVPAYVKLNERNDKAAVEKQMNELLVKYGAEDMKAMGFQKTLSLEPLSAIYLRSDIGQSPRITYLYVVASIAVFILLIACINFMNLSTAKASKRAAEIGVRKAMGAFRSSLIKQLLGEAMVIVVLSIIISVVLVQAFLPLFNEITGKSISFGTENLFYFLAALAAIALITGLLAGCYPAFYLSSFEPAHVLKGKATIGKSSGWLRQSLVVAQFVIAITLTCGMVIIFRQLDFMQQKDLGFTAQSKIIIPLRTTEARQQYASLKKEIANLSSIASVSGADYIPGSTIWSDMAFYTEGGNMDRAQMIRRNSVDYQYLEMLDIKLLTGRSFTDNREMDSDRKVIVNRTACQKFGMTPEQLTGQNIYFDWQGTTYSFAVIGVMEGYHQTSLKETIQPVLFELASTEDQFSNVIITVAPGRFDQTLSSLEALWKKQVGDTPFEFTFLDENLQRLYENDRKISVMINSFTIIAMAICCLGLYGLSSYMAERRIKEIGVRKVLGASVHQIVTMMSMEFVRLVAIALVVSVPLAWYAMSEWLSTFAYRISVTPDVFVLAGIGSLLIALLTVSYESLRAATSNPVQSLRSE